MDEDQYDTRDYFDREEEEGVRVLLAESSA